MRARPLRLASHAALTVSPATVLPRLLFARDADGFFHDDPAAVGAPPAWPLLRLLGVYVLRLCASFVVPGWLLCRMVGVVGVVGAVLDDQRG